MRQLITSVTVVEWVKLLFFPVIVKLNVPVLARELTETVKVELPVVVTGFGLKLPLTLLGNPLTLRLTELEPFTALRETV